MVVCEHVDRFMRQPTSPQTNPLSCNSCIFETKSPCQAWRSHAYISKVLVSSRKVTQSEFTPTIPQVTSESCFESNCARPCLTFSMHDRMLIMVKHWKCLCENHFTVGKRNYFTVYRILLHELPVVAVLFSQSNNNVHVVKLQNLDFLKYGINLVK